MNLTPLGFGIVVAAVLVVAVIVAIAEEFRDRREDEPEDDHEQDDDVQQQVNRYHCAAHGCYYRAHPEVFADRDVWTCKICGTKATSYHSTARKPFDQAAS